MDGTVYLGERLLPGVNDLLRYFRRAGKRYLFLTNNSSKRRGDYLQKLRRLGVEGVSEDEIFTSGEAAAGYLRARRPGARLCVVGTPALQAEFQAAGFTLDDAAPEVVVLGFDTGITYERIRLLCDHVRAGLPYIATHPDLNCPVDGGTIPDTGAFIALVQASTGRRPDVIIGKPFEPIIAALAEKTGVAPAQVTMVGDRLATDIALGQHGPTTVLVLSGETRPEHIPDAEVPPDYVLRDLAELLERLEGQSGAG